MLTPRTKTRPVAVGNVIIGGGSPVSVQSMTNTDTRDAAATLRKIAELRERGCEIVRAAVPDAAAAAAFAEIKKRCPIPLAADIHFDYRLALAAIEAGADKLRLNPGNIGSRERVALVAKAAKARGIPIRIGVNSGSLDRDILEKYGRVTAGGLVESALRHVRILEELEFYDIVVSIKSHDVGLCLEAYTLLSEQCEYPLHVGVTEAGTRYAGTIKSACGLGAVLSRGIGDTVRVSLCGDPVHEVDCARAALQALGLRRFAPELIVCPTCGRTGIDLLPIAERVEAECKTIGKYMKIAVMGCAVNGPGEAREADLGLAGGKGAGLIFSKGQVLRKVAEKDLVAEFIKEIHKLAETLP